jgi:hypothetical protein
MGKTKKTFNEIQLNQRGEYRARWEQVFEDDREKRKRPRGTRFIIEDEEESDGEPDGLQNLDEMLYPEGETE